MEKKKNREREERDKKDKRESLGRNCTSLKVLEIHCQPNCRATPVAPLLPQDDVIKMSHAQMT